MRISIPDAQCMKYFLTFTRKTTQMYVDRLNRPYIEHLGMGKWTFQPKGSFVRMWHFGGAERMADLEKSIAGCGTYGTPRVGDPWRMGYGGLGVYRG